MKLPLDELREKYIPVVDFPDRFNISVDKVNELIESRRIRYAEFRAPGDRVRTKHANYEEVLAALGLDKE